jgi:hypothetical protein
VRQLDKTLRELGYKRRKITRGVVEYQRHPDRLQTYEAEQPWIVYTYLTTDRWTRITGVSKIECECAVCGERKVLKICMPRFGKIMAPAGGKHVKRLEFLRDHLHRDAPRHPMAWAKPLLNPAAHKGGIDLDLLAMRLEADLREARGAA